MKHSFDPFVVSPRYRSELLAKVSAWQRAFGVRKAVHVTLVTAAGLHPNENADVVQSEVRLADLLVRVKQKTAGATRRSFGCWERAPPTPSGA